MTDKPLLPSVSAVRALMDRAGGKPSVEHFDWEVDTALAQCAETGSLEPLRAKLWHWLEVGLIAANPAGVPDLDIQRRGAHLEQLAASWMIEHGEVSPIPPETARLRAARHAAAKARETWLAGTAAAIWPSVAEDLRRHDPDCHSLIHWVYLPTADNPPTCDVTRCDGECGLAFHAEGLAATSPDGTGLRLCECCLRTYAGTQPSRRIVDA